MNGRIEAKSTVAADVHPFCLPLTFHKPYLVSKSGVAV
jgi:hypothetical protein